MIQIPFKYHRNLGISNGWPHSREMQSGAACFVRISRAISLTQAESRYIAIIVSPGRAFFVKVSAKFFESARIEMDSIK